MDDTFSKKGNSIHLIGIGGIGVSALARYYLAKGNKVTGSDLQSSEITQELVQLGVPIALGAHSATHIPQEAQRIIYTAATPKSNPELKTAVKRGLEVKTYAQAVGEITQKYRTITISGSHGKSTTTALAALVLEDGYYDPVVMVGTKIKEFSNSNFRYGRGPYLVLEADEWNKSFLNYTPEIAIITNIDAEHLDTYKTLGAVKTTFQEYLEKIPHHGKIIANEDDDSLRSVAKKFGMKVRWYSLRDKEASLVRDVLRISGEHNVSNALAALHLGRLLGIAEADILRALSRFTGAWRRFELKGIINGAFIFTDYGHHPTEIAATIEGARNRFPFRRIWCIYQPHQYQRLAYAWDGFLHCFDKADHVAILPVYDVAGRETKTTKHVFNSQKLTSTLTMRGKHAEYLTSFTRATTLIHNHARPGDIFLIMGAGNIYTLKI